MGQTVDIVCPVCCGMDVHKSFIVAYVAVTGERNNTVHHIRRFPTFTGDLRRLAEWLKSYECKGVCMESTGKYWIPVFNILEKPCNVCLTHPKYVKTIKGKKTDKKDAKWISELFKCDLVRPSFIPPSDIRQLRDLCRYYVKLACMNSSKKNRAQNCLTMCNFKLDDVFSDVFGTSAARVLNKLIEQGNSDFDVAPLLHKRCKATVDEVRAALDSELNESQSEKLKFIIKHHRCISGVQSLLEAAIMRLAGEYQPQIQLLMSVSGISAPFTAVRILAEIGADMSVSETSKHLCSWAGLTPQNQESAGKKKTARIARAGAYLKPLLVQIALSIGKSNKCAGLKSKYMALKKRCGGKKAVIAISRKLLTIVLHILSKGEFYNADLHNKADKPPTARELTPEQAFSLLRSKGYVIKAIPESV